LFGSQYSDSMSVSAYSLTDSGTAAEAPDLVYTLPIATVDAAADDAV